MTYCIICFAVEENIREIRLDDGFGFAICKIHDQKLLEYYQVRKIEIISEAI